MKKVLYLLFFILLINSQVLLAGMNNFGDAAAKWLGEEFQNLGRVNTTLDERMGASLVISNFFKEKGWSVRHLNGYANSGKFAGMVPKMSFLTQVQQAPKKEKLLISHGFYFIENQQDKRVIFKVISGRFIEVFAKDRLIAAATLSEFKDFFKRNSPYKGQIVEYDGQELKFLDGVDDINVSWKHFIFPEKKKKEIKHTIDHFIGNYDEGVWNRYKLPHSRGVILYGPPGTGKSFIGKVLVSNVIQKKYKNKVTYIQVQARHISTVQGVRSVFQIARRYRPAILFFEDIDLISGTDRTDLAEIKNELMQQLSGVEQLKGVLTIGTTNYFERIDYALKRSKRLGYHFKIGKPSFSSREKLFELFLKKDQLVLDNVNFRKLSILSEGFTGSDINEVVEHSIQRSYVSGLKRIKIQQSIIENEIKNKILNIIKK